MTKTIKKFIMLLLSAMLVIGVVFTLAACGEDDKNPTGGTGDTGGKKFPASESDGWVQTYNGGYESVVHRVLNEESGNSIYGRVFYKKDTFDENDEYPLCIMSHGANTVSVDAANGFMQYMLDKGFVVYTFDFCGGSPMSKSEGDTEDLTTETSVSDLECVIEEITTLPYVDSDNVVLFGHSRGGLITGLTAASHSDELKGIILHAPALGSVLDQIGSFDKYVFLMNGTEDRDQTETLDAYNARPVPAAPSCELHMVEGADHYFSESEYHQMDEYLDVYLVKIGIFAE